MDNGISQWDTTEAPKYVSNTSLGSRVGLLNPKWNEDGSEEVLNSQFLKAVELTGAEFKVWKREGLIPTISRTSNGKFQISPHVVTSMAHQHHRLCLH